MKDKIREICYDLEIGCIDWTEASELLFALCDVGSSLPFENSESKLCKTCNGNGVMWFNLKVYEMVGKLANDFCK